MVQANIYRQPDPADPVLDEATVLRFARRHLPSASAVTAVDETGGEARAYVIDEQYIFKTQRQHRVRTSTSIEKAAFHQQVIAKEAPEVTVPRVLGYGRDGDIEYVLETRVPGVAVRNVVLEGQARWSVLFDLGRALRRIHGVDLAPFEASGLFPGDKDGMAVRNRIESSLHRSMAAITAQPEIWPLAISPETAVTKALQSVTDESRTALHSNPGPEHVFVDPVSFQFQGVIDFGDAYISHPTFDMRRWSSPDDRAALIQGYGSEAEIDDSFLATRRAVIVAGLMAIIAGLGPGASAMRPERRKAALDDLPSSLAELY
jgi:aminoglycoside phosphotransferase (APT) family kinase protein